METLSILAKLVVKDVVVNQRGHKWEGLLYVTSFVAIPSFRLDSVIVFHGSSCLLL